MLKAIANGPCWPHPTHVGLTD